jgi:uncharacterized protein (TIRG00374 family)
VAWTLVGTALGIALLYAATRQVDAAAMADSLHTLSWPWASLVLAATLAFCAIKAWRWGLLLDTAPRIAFRDLHAAVYLGLAVNFLVAHVGELLRAAAVARRQRIPVGTVLASVVIERVLDFIAILALLALPVMATPQAPDAVVAAAVASAAFVAVAVTGLVLLLHPPAWSARAVSWLGGKLRPQLRDRAAHHLARFRAGLAPLMQPGLMATALFASALQWALVAAAIWASGLAVAGFVSPMAAIVTFVLIILGLTLPNSPLQIGTTQLAFVVGLGIDGTGVSIAIAASLVYTTFLILPIMLAGALLMMRYPRDE